MSGVCNPKAANGGACDVNNECASDNCNNWICCDFGQMCCATVSDCPATSGACVDATQCIGDQASVDCLNATCVASGGTDYATGSVVT